MTPATTDEAGGGGDATGGGGGAGALFASLWALEDEFPDAEVSFDMPWTQQLTVQRDGVRYHVEEYGRHGRGYRYGVCAELPTVDRYGRETTEVASPRYSNAVETWPEAVDLLRHVLRADPRQSSSGDGGAW